MANFVAEVCICYFFDSSPPWRPLLLRHSSPFAQWEVTDRFPEVPPSAQVLRSPLPYRKECPSASLPFRGDGSRWPSRPTRRRPESFRQFRGASMPDGRRTHGFLPHQSPGRAESLRGRKTDRRHTRFCGGSSHRNPRFSAEQILALVFGKRRLHFYSELY